MYSLIRLLSTIVVIACSGLAAQDLSWPEELYVPVYEDVTEPARLTVYSEQTVYAAVFKAWERLAFQVHDSLIEFKQIVNYYGADEPWLSTRISNHYADLSGSWLKTIVPEFKAGLSWVPMLRIRRGAGAPSHLQSTVQAGPYLALKVKKIPVTISSGAALAGYADTLSSFASHWQSLGRRSEPGVYYRVSLGSSDPLSSLLPVSLITSYDRRDLAGFSYNNFIATSRGVVAHALDSVFGYGQMSWWQGAGSTVSEDSIGRLATGTNLPYERRQINGSAGIKGSPRFGLSPNVVYQLKRVFDGTRDLREVVRTSNAVSIGLHGDTTRVLTYRGNLGFTWIYEDHLPGQDIGNDPLKKVANILDMRGLISTMSHNVTLLPYTALSFEYLYNITANRQDYPVANRLQEVSDDQDRIYSHHRLTGKYAPTTSTRITGTAEYLEGLTNFINSERSGSNRTDRQYKGGLSGNVYLQDSCMVFVDGMMIARSSTLMFLGNQALIMPPYSRSFVTNGGIRAALGFSWVALVQGSLEYSDRGYWYDVKDTLAQKSAYYAIDKRMTSPSVYASLKYRFSQVQEVALEGETRFYRNGTYAVWESQVLRRGSLMLKGVFAVGEYATGEGYIQYVNDTSRKENVYGGLTLRAAF